MLDAILSKPTSILIPPHGRGGLLGAAMEPLLIVVLCAVNFLIYFSVYSALPIDSREGVLYGG